MREFKHEIKLKKLRVLLLFIGVYFTAFPQCHRDLVEGLVTNANVKDSSETQLLEILEENGKIKQILESKFDDA